MAPAASPRIDPRRERTTRALLAAANEVFAQRGVEEATVEDIASRAGVAVGSIYNNFGSKAGLYAAAVDQALDVDREYMDRAYSADRTAIEQLLAAAEQYLRFYLEHPMFFRMLAFPAAAGNNPAAAETAARLSRRVDEQNARMVAAIERGIQEGSLRPMDAHMAATFLWATWNGVISLAWRPDELQLGEAQLRELLERGADIISWGLRSG